VALKNRILRERASNPEAATSKRVSEPASGKAGAVSNQAAIAIRKARAAASVLAVRPTQRMKPDPTSSV
jgi:hypothetical protein